MQVLDPGHCYSVDYFDNVDGDGNQIVEPLPIQFMKRIGDKFPGNEGPPVPGTNCQEVLRVLIDRVKYLENQVPCKENRVIIGELRNTIQLFEWRAAQRHGTECQIFAEDVENVPACPVCGHIFGCDCLDCDAVHDDPDWEPPFDRKNL